MKKKEDPNDDLTEIIDTYHIKEIKEGMNINFQELDGVAPYIGGSVINGGFTRKLKMLRGDVFSALAVCQSPHYVTSSK